MSAGRSGIQSGRAFILLSIRDVTRQGLVNVEKRLQAFAGSIRRIGVGLTGIGTAAATAFVPAIKAASDFQENLSKFDVVFGRNAKTIRQFGNDLASQLGRSENQIVKFLASSQDLFVPLGFDERQAIELSKTLTQLAVDLASFNNISDDVALRDLQAALTGSGETMKKYGVVVSEARVKQQLLNQSIDPRVATEAQKAYARLAIILEGTAAAQGDAVRTSDSFANQMKRLRGEMENLAVAIGTPIISALGGFVRRISDSLKSFREWIQLNPKFVQAVAAGTVALTGMGVALTGLSFLVGGFAAAILALSTPLGAAVGAIGALGLAFIDFRKLAEQATTFVDQDFKRTIQGVEDAVKSNRVQDAFRVLWLGARIETQKGLSSMLEDVRAGMIRFANQINPFIQLDALLTGASVDEFSEQQISAIQKFTDNVFERGIRGLENQRTALLRDLERAADQVESTDVVGVGDAASAAIGGAVESLDKVLKTTLTKVQGLGTDAISRLTRFGAGHLNELNRFTDRFGVAGRGIAEALRTEAMGVLGGTLAELNLANVRGEVQDNQGGRIDELRRQRDRAIIEARGVLANRAFNQAIVQGAGQAAKIVATQISKFDRQIGDGIQTAVSGLSDLAKRAQQREDEPLKVESDPRQEQLAEEQVQELRQANQSLAVISTEIRRQAVLSFK